MLAARGTSAKLLQLRPLPCSPSSATFGLASTSASHFSTSTPQPRTRANAPSANRKENARRAKDEEQQRQDRIADRLLNAAKLGVPPPRAPTGSDPYAGWQPTPGRSSRRNLGRPQLEQNAADLSARYQPPDVETLLGPYTASKLKQPLSPRELDPDAVEAADTPLQQQQSVGLFLDDFTQPARRLKAGDFVEIRKNYVRTIGIVLPPPQDEWATNRAQQQQDAGSSSQMQQQYKPKLQGDIFVLVSSGQVVLYRDSDVMFQIPELVSKGLCISAAPLTRDYVASSLNNDVTMDGVDSGEAPNENGAAGGKGQAGAMTIADEPVDETRFQARAALCNKLRIIERRGEKEMQRLLPAFRSLFLVDASERGAQGSGKKHDERVDLLTGTITAYEAARLMNDHVTSADDSKAVTAITIMAAHTLLMNTPTHFLADTLSHRTSQLFTCRSEEEGKTLRLLTEWVRSPPGSSGQKHIDDFCAKVQKVRAWYAHHPYQPDGAPRHVEAEGLGVEWSDTDRTILSFLEASLGSRREIQLDKHGSIAMEIVKRAGADIRSKPLPNVRKGGNGLEDAARELLFPASYPADPSASVSAEGAQPKQHEYEILKDLGGQVSASGDLQHAAVVRLLKSIGYLSPWYNLIRLDATFRTLVSGERDGQPEPPSDRTRTASASAAASSSSVVAAKPQYSYDDGIEKIRHDFGKDLPVYVIDDADAFELDDGVSIEPVAGSTDQFWIHVHVADPTAALRPSDALSARARRRFTTLYLPEARWALLPDDFVNDGVGLRAPIGESGEGQRVFTMSAKVDARTGQVDDYAIRPAVVHNVQVMSYSGVNEVLQQSGHAELGQLHRVAKALSEARVRGTALNAWRTRANLSVSPLPLPDTYGVEHRIRPQFYAGSPTVSLSIGTPQSDPAVNASQFLVSELMLLAGRVAGAFGDERDLPLPYRLQPRPEDPEVVRRILAMREPKTGSVEFHKLLAEDLTLSAGTYSDRSGEHFALGICLGEHQGAGQGDALARGGYLRATSPLRRYPDMVTHWQLKSALVGRHPVFSRTELRERLGQFERSEMLSRNLQRGANLLWLTKAVDEAMEIKRRGGGDGKGEKEKLALLGPHEAIVFLTGVKINPQTYQGHIRVEVDGLGVAADLLWDLKRPPPVKGQKFKIEVVNTVSAGLRSSITVREVQE